MFVAVACTFLAGCGKKAEKEPPVSSPEALSPTSLLLLRDEANRWKREVEQRIGEASQLKKEASEARSAVKAAQASLAELTASAEAHRREINQLNSQATDARHTAKAEGKILGHLTVLIETVREELKELKVQAADVRQATKAEEATLAHLKDRTAKEERQREWAKQQPAEPNKEAIHPAPTPAPYSIVGKWSATLDPDRGFVRECVFTPVKMCSLDYYIGYRSCAGSPLRGVYRYDREKAVVTVSFPRRNLTQRLYWTDQDSFLCEDETGRILAFSRPR